MSDKGEDQKDCLSVCGEHVETDNKQTYTTTPTKEEPSSSSSSPPTEKDDDDAAKSTKCSSTTEEEKRPSSPPNKKKNVAAKNDDDVVFYGISIMSLATSLTKEKQMPRYNPSSSTGPRVGVSQLLAQRKVFMSHPDPRPAASCSWCGCEKDNDIRCPICDMLAEHGWSSYYNTEQVFRDHKNERMRGVKNFLLASTDYVVKAMNAISEEDRLRLIGQYETANEQASNATPQKRQRNETTTETTSFSETYIQAQRSKEIIIQLPSISQLLTQDNGLKGVLKADVHSVYNMHFGSNANIAAKILLTLGKGDIPPDVDKEVPFLRSSQTLQEFTNYGSSDTTRPPSRFVGVFRVIDDERSYAVGMPEFHIMDDDCDDTRKGPTPPKEATVNNGQLCLIRVGIKDEKTAGQLFAYMYRILYGTNALSDVLKASNNQDDLTTTSSSQDVSGGGSLKAEDGADIVRL